MGKRDLKQFYLCVVDSDNKVFSVEGPMSNDESWNEAVCEAQSAGRSVHCFVCFRQGCVTSGRLHCYVQISVAVG